MRLQNPMVSPLQIGEHGVLALSFQDDRLHRYDSVWDEGSQLVRHTARVGQIGDDEPGHVGQRGDRPGEVLAGGLLEIEQDRQIIALAELVSNRVENYFSLRRKATQN